MNRVSIRMIPNTPASCPMLDCPYNQNESCDTPRVNKGNSDAFCHSMGNADMLDSLLGLPIGRKEQQQ
jgi:hypothetical protein